MYCKLNTHPLGCASVPTNWARLTNAFAFILLRLPLLWIAIYVDDRYAIEPAETALSALLTLRGLARLLGLALGPGKEVWPKVSALLLWAILPYKTLYSGRITT